jgi:hypothetical protein
MKTKNHSPHLCYASFWGKLLRKWDWWIYRKACGSIRRMALDNPGLSYLMELYIRGWNEETPISPELKHATEEFYNSLLKAKNQIDD